MDDLASKLNQILNSPEGMEQLRSVAASLGLSDNSANNNIGGAQSTAPVNNPPSNSGMDLSAISSLLSGLGVGGGGGNNQSAPAPPLLPNIDINTIMRLQQAMSQLNTSDKNVELLLAVKSHFGADRQKKVDDAIRIMQLIKLLPLIKESGIFGGGLF